MFGAGACGSDGSGEGASSGVDGGGFVEGGSSILLPSDAAPDGPVPSPFGLDQRPANPTCKAGPRPSTGATLKFEPVYPNLAGRVAIMGTFKAPGNRAFWYALLRNGLVQRFDDRPDVTDYSPVLDIQDIVSASGEGGLLGLAFHPDWATNRTAFLYYTVPSAEKLLDKSVLARIRSTDGGLTFDRSTLEPLLELDQPFDNHKGGTIAFGPDGELYMAFGDGGGAGDTLRTSQDRSQLLGKVIRIHVGTTGPYTVPADNPFVGVAGTRPEIWAIGFRNPYRWSFDRGDRCSTCRQRRQDRPPSGSGRASDAQRQPSPADADADQAGTPARSPAAPRGPGDPGRGHLLEFDLHDLPVRPAAQHPLADPADAPRQGHPRPDRQEHSAPGQEARSSAACPSRIAGGLATSGEEALPDEPSRCSAAVRERPARRPAAPAAG